ncbi:MAG: hypothetical protein TQ35_0009395 [Candidatus Aramenus sulfurataquae]|uniref:Uncharacterized protein n=1 Tax=Candidatus Aramenus sulfurataquae TaxID=1326980 RepID=A0ACC6TRF3_9CREN
MSLATELKNAVDEVYTFSPNKKQLRLLGIPQDYDIEGLDEDIKKLLDDEELKKDMLNLMSALFNLLSSPDLDYLTTIQGFLEKYSDKLERLNTIHELLNNLPAEEYKNYWLNKYYRTLDELMKGKEEFLKVIEEREGVNTVMEFYYKVFIRLLTELVDNIRRYDTKELEKPKARDDKGLRKLVSATNILIFVLSYPIIAYLEGERVDYETLTSLIVVLAKPSTIKDKYSLLFGEAIFE